MLVNDPSINMMSKSNPNKQIGFILACIIVADAMVRLLVSRCEKIALEVKRYYLLWKPRLYPWERSHANPPVALNHGVDSGQIC